MSYSVTYNNSAATIYNVNLTNGNVGIGTTPTEKLTIAGNLSASGTVTATNLVYTTGNQTIAGAKTFSNRITTLDSAYTGSYNFNTSTGYFQPANDVRNWYPKGLGPSITTDEGTPTGLFLSSDGLTVYIIGSTSDNIRSYPLSVAWDITTQSATSSVTLNVGSAADSAPQDLHFSPNGVYLYFVGSTNDRVYRYTLSTPWNLATAVYDGLGASLSVATQDLSPVGLTMSPDVTKLYMLGSTNDTVYRYNLSTPWDLTTATYHSSFLVANQESNPQGLCFNNAGTLMYVIGTVGDDITEYRLSVAWDITTAVYFGESFAFVHSYVEGNPNGIFIDENTNNAYIIGITIDRVLQFGTDYQIKHYGNSLVTDGQFYVGGRVEFKDSLYVNGVITSLGGSSTFAGAIINGTLTTNGNVFLGNISGNSTGAIMYGATGTTFTKTVTLGAGGRFGSTTTIGMGSIESSGSISIDQQSTFNRSVSISPSLSVLNKIDPLIAGNSATGAIAVSDAFTETVDTLLQSHTPNVGTSWSRVQVNSATASFTIEASTDTLKPTATIADVGVIYVENTALTNADYEVSINLITQVANDNQIWLLARYQDVNNFYGVKWSSSSANCGLFKRVGGVYTQLGLAPNLTPTSGSTSLSLRVVGNVISVVNGGTVMIAAVDSDITAAGYAGLAGGNIGQLATDNLNATWRMDNFKVQYYTVGTSVFENGDVRISNGGLILKAPNGTLYKVTVDNTGTLITTAV